MSKTAPRPSAIEMDAEQRLRVLKRVRYAHLSQDQFNLLVATCRERGLSAWMEHMWIASVPGIDRNQIVTMCTIHGLRHIAAAQPDYVGQRGPVWCGADGVWKRFWPDGVTPVAARVGVLRAGFAKPVWGTAYWQEAAVPKVDEDGNPETGDDEQPILSKPWMRQPRYMLAKVSEALALRRAFPEKLGGLYTSDEMPRLPRSCKPHIQSLSPQTIAIEDDTPATLASLQSRLMGQTDMSLGEINEMIAEYRSKYPRLFAPDDKRPFCAVVLAEMSRRAEPVGAGA